MESAYFLPCCTSVAESAHAHPWHTAARAGLHIQTFGWSAPTSRDSQNERFSALRALACVTELACAVKLCPEISVSHVRKLLSCVADNCAEKTLKVCQQRNGVRVGF